MILETMQRGGCLCGTVRFTTHGQLRNVVACHCSQCRRQTGLYYAATSVPLDRLSFDGGEETLGWYRASDRARRGFCRECGSALFWIADGAAEISIMAGSFDQPSGLVMGRHIYCDDKADFYDLPEDGAPRYAGGQPAD